MKVRATILSTAFVAFATLSIASGQTPDAPPQPPPAPQAEDSAPPPPPPPAPAQTPQIRRFIETMNALANGASCLQGTMKDLGVVSQRPQSAAAPSARVDKLPITRNTMVLVSAGAASGAAIGAAVTKDGRGPMYGAIAGGAAGLIYDLITRKDAATY